jgi:DNA polymerase-3 subunit beta
MKATVDTRILRQAVRLAAPVASRKSSLPIVTHLKITANGRLEIEATNLEQRIHLPVPAQIAAPGSCTVPARWFARFLRSVSAETVELDLNQWQLRLRADGLTASIQGQDPAEHPSVPYLVPGQPTHTLRLDGGDFRELVRRVIFATSRDETRPVLQGVEFRMTPDRMTAAACDGFRVVVAPLTQFDIEPAVDPAQPISLLLPAKLLEFALARLPLAKGRLLTITWNSDNACIETEGGQLDTYVISGNFPDYTAIIPKELSIGLRVDKARLLPALRRAVDYEPDNMIGHLEVDYAAQQMQISVSNSEIGQLEQVVPVVVDQKPEEAERFLIAFNLRYLAEAVEHLPDETVLVKMNAPNRPATLEAGDCLAVLMPMHLR